MKTQVDIEDEIAILDLKKIAIKNGLKHSKPDLINLAIKIYKDCFQYLDKESFEQVTNLEI
jgi:hypothetical protein